MIWNWLQKKIKKIAVVLGFSLQYMAVDRTNVFEK